MLKTIQAVSGLLFFLFASVHLVNSWLSLGGEVLYNSVQANLRQVYQFPVIELLILGALLTHISVGLLRIFKEPKRDLSPRAKWHRYSGMFLLLVIFGHIGALRAPSYLADVYPEFAGVAFAVAYLPYVFIPYYFVLLLGGFYHSVNGLSIASRRLGLPLLPAQWPVKSMLGVAAVLSALTVLQLAGGLWPISDPAQSEFAKFALEFLGQTAEAGGH